MASVNQAWRAVTAYRMLENGSTNNRIDEFVGVAIERVPVLVKLGERLDSLNKKEEEKQ